MRPLFYSFILNQFSFFISNADQFQYVYENAENLFKKLLGLLDEWTDKVALGTIDLENLAKNHIKLASDWDMNFRTSKAWGQEIAKIIK